MCDCKDHKITTWNGAGAHHRVNCPKYNTEKFTYLFYSDDDTADWIPASEKIENVIDVTDFEANEERRIWFKRFDLTDREYADIPAQ